MAHFSSVIRKQGSALSLRRSLYVAALITVIVALVVTIVMQSQGGSLRLLAGDTISYYGMYQELVGGTFDAGDFRFGIGFFLFSRAFSIVETFRNPFILPSMLLFVFMSFHLYLIARIFFRDLPSLFCLALVLATSPTFEFFVQGQNVTVTATLLVYSISIALRRERIRIESVLILGFLTGLDMSSRYIDGLLFIPILAYICYRCFEVSRKSALVRIVCFLVTCLPWVAVTFLFHATYLGSPWKTPYSTRVSFVSRVEADADIEESQFYGEGHYLSNLPRNLYQVLIDPYAYALPSTIDGYASLGMRMPYLLFLPFGLYVAVRNRNPSRLLMFGVLTTMLGFLVLYGSHWAFTAHDLKCLCLRYLCGWYPLFGVLALYGAVEFLRVVHQTWLGVVPFRRLALGLVLHVLLFGAVRAVPLIHHCALKTRAYDKTQWRSTASRNPEDARLAIDNDLSTGWSTAPAPMAPGDSFSLDLGSLSEVSELQLDLRSKSETDFPWRVAVYSSVDGQHWERIPGAFSGRHNHVWYLEFPAVFVRWIRLTVVVVESPGRTPTPWTVFEIDVMH